MIIVYNLISFKICILPVKIIIVFAISKCILVPLCNHFILSPPPLSKQMLTGLRHGPFASVFWNYI